MGYGGKPKSGSKKKGSKKRKSVAKRKNEIIKGALSTIRGALGSKASSNPRGGAAATRAAKKRQKRVMGKAY